jgi:hypothetical protein
MPLFFVLTLVLAMPALVYSQEEAKPVCKKSAQLDKDVMIKLEKLNLQHKLDVFDLKAEKGKIHEAMMAELMKDEPSRKEIDKLFKSMNGVNSKLHKIKVDYLLKVKGILPADHWKLFLSKHHGSGCSCSGCESGCHCKGMTGKGGSCMEKCGSGMKIKMKGCK